MVSSVQNCCGLKKRAVKVSRKGAKPQSFKSILLLFLRGLAALRELKTEIV